MFRLESQRLILRPVDEKDLDTIWEAAQYPGLADGMYWEPPEDKEILRSQLKKEAISPKRIPLVIADKNDVLVGRLFLNCLSGEWEIGYWLLPSQRGKGYAFEAAQIALQFVFGSLGAKKIIASSCLWNKKSRLVLVKLGMKSCGIRKGGLKKKKGSYDVEDFELLSGDFFPSKIAFLPPFLHKQENNILTEY